MSETEEMKMTGFFICPEVWHILEWWSVWVGAKSHGFQGIGFDLQVIASLCEAKSCGSEEV